MAAAIETKLYVTNFPSSATRQQLQQFFSRFGRVQECAIMWNSYAFVHYATMEEARRALEQSNGAMFLNRKLIVQLSTSRFRPQPKETTHSSTPKQLMIMSNYSHLNNGGGSTINQSQQQQQQQQSNTISQQYPNELNYDLITRSSPVLEGNHLYSNPYHPPYSNLPIERITSSPSTLTNNKIHLKNSKNDLGINGDLPKLYCTNLPDNCQSNELQRLFSSFGHVIDCVILWDYYAFITYQTFHEAERALHTLHGYTWKDRRLIVEWSRASGRRQQQQQTSPKLSTSELSTPSSPRSRQSTIVSNGQIYGNASSFNQNLAMMSLLQQQQQMPLNGYSNSDENHLDLSPFIDSNSTSIFSPSSDLPTPSSPISNSNIYQPSDIITLLEPTTTTTTNNGKIQDNSLINELTNTLSTMPNFQSTCSSAAAVTENFLASLFNSFEPFNKYHTSDEQTSRYNTRISTSSLLTTAPDYNHPSMSYGHNSAWN